MLCTRWYLPLVLLPLPIASSYFLVLFLFSTTLHARPCFYCIVLLTAMFMSSCYWPPVPLDTQLTMPWAPNITTFSEALLSVMPDLPTNMIPDDIPILDRCWCDLTSGSFFEPYNVTQWEVLSVEKLKWELEKQIKASEVEEEENNVESIAGVPSKEHTTSSKEIPEETATLVTKWNGFWDRWAFFHATDPSLKMSPSVTHEQSNATTENLEPLPHHRISESEGRTSIPVSYSPVPGPPLPFLRREYDLRPYGFDMVVDFGWSHS